MPKTKGCMRKNVNNAMNLLGLEFGSISVESVFAFLSTFRRSNFSFHIDPRNPRIRSSDGSGEILVCALFMTQIFPGTNREVDKIRGLMCHIVTLFTLFLKPPSAPKHEVASSTASTCISIYQQMISTYRQIST